ncbi:MAG: PSD1 domain-containing protein [Planctomycetaceae bacterium]|nr:PSD1 domain-containing protein [Planctomycetaceae bacterium]
MPFRAVLPPITASARPATDPGGSITVGFGKVARATQLVLIGTVCAATALGADPPSDQVIAGREAFFEAKIRPILIAHCTECHGEKKQESGLRVDTRAALSKGGDSGPALRDDQPMESLLLEVINYNGDIQMPPRQKLSDEDIALLTAWVRDGAAFPATEMPAAPALGFAATPDGLLQSRTSHWAYQPVRRPPIPITESSTWAKNAVDRFVLAELESAGLSPSQPADRRTLLRRLTFDLTGLPPTWDDVVAFENDSAPDAVERLIERLLASPQYGERWGRHWLDIARYADTKGYVFTEERKYPFSYTYRDYVIDAFNRDVPFNQFVMEQLAADQLGGEAASLAAMGFLTVGRRFGNNPHDIIDDRIDVVSRGLLGLTVACARCHDHKYDAIPTADYYSLYGVFASSVEPGELPQIGDPENIEAYRVYEEELQRRQAAVNEFVTTSAAELRDELRMKSGLYLLAAISPDPPQRDREVKPPIVGRWREYLAATANESHPIFGPWHVLTQLPGEGFPDAARAAISVLNEAPDANPRTNAQVKQALQSAALATKDDVARVYGELLAGVQEEWIKLRDSDVAALPDADREEVRQVLYADNSPIAAKDEELQRLLGRDKRDKLTKFKRAVEEHQATSPGAPPRAMVMNDAAQPVQPHILVRGNPGRQGDPVPRQFLQVLQDEPRPFQQGSGRLELARAIVDPANPLTARVIVNRVWQQHFGKGLVRTPSDFGIRGEEPTHPELLDWLASRFIENGWSLKWLHRTILSSAVYQQSSEDRPEGQQLDPENRLLWKMNRRRLEFEPLRDSLFAVADRLDDRLAGRPVDLFAQPYPGRRAVYGFIDRQDLPGTLRVFDFASPDVSTAQRPETTVPQQLLYQMNSPLVLEQARHLAKHAQSDAEGDPESSIAMLYHRAFARDATRDELAAAKDFLSGEASLVTDSPAADPLTPLEQLAQALLLTNEFAFID